MIRKQVLPDLQAAGDVHAAIRIDPQAGGQQHHIGVGAEDRTGRTRAGHLSADRRIEALHARGLGQVCLHRTVDARQRIEVAGQPAIVPCGQLFQKHGALVGRRAGQFGPDHHGAGSSGHDGLAIADLEHAAKEIQHVRVGPSRRGIGMPLRNSSAV